MVICSHLFEQKQRLFTSSQRQIDRQTSPLRVSQSSTKTDQNPPEYGLYKNSKNQPECGKTDSNDAGNKLGWPSCQPHIGPYICYHCCTGKDHVQTYIFSINQMLQQNAVPFCSISRYFKINWLLSIFKPLIVLPIANILVSTGPGHFTCRTKFVNLENT